MFTARYGLGLDRSHTLTVLTNHSVTVTIYIVVYRVMTQHSAVSEKPASYPQQEGRRFTHTFDNTAGYKVLHRHGPDREQLDCLTYHEQHHSRLRSVPKWDVSNYICKHCQGLFWRQPRQTLRLLTSGSNSHFFPQFASRMTSPPLAPCQLQRILRSSTYITAYRTSGLAEGGTAGRQPFLFWSTLILIMPSNPTSSG